MVSGAGTPDMWNLVRPFASMIYHEIFNILESSLYLTLLLDGL